MGTRRIHVLPDHVANQIAAGEVVERPASVVKELVENALDAGARRIRVELEDGGKRLIRVLDDGCGMSPEDALVAIRRHATSKVRDAADLVRIGSLGFRGEALPSIQSVSRLRLRTRTPDADAATLVTFADDGRPEVAPAGAPPGTDIVVRDLFYNVPARRKFLRRSATELQRVRSLIGQLALGWPDVGFTLVHDGRRILVFPEDGDIRSRILAVLGREICARLLPARLTFGEHEVAGYVGEPSLHRPTPKDVYTFVNGRFVRDRVIQSAVVQGYGEALPRGRHPVVVLYVVVPPEGVDVNVHPAKAEVRFVESGAVHSLVQRAVGLALQDAPPVALPDGAPVPPPDATALELALSGAHARSAPVAGETRVSTMGSAGPGRSPASAPVAPAPSPGPGDALGELMGRLGGTVAILRRGEGLVLVDLVAAHRALLHHELFTGLGGAGVPGQPLLFPAPVELSDGVTIPPWFERLGLLCEPFGGRDYVVTCVPAPLAGADPARLLRVALAARGPDQAAVALAEAVADGQVDLAALAAAPERGPDGVPWARRLAAEEIIAWIQAR